MRRAFLLSALLSALPACAADCVVYKPFAGPDLLQLVIYASIAFGLLKLFVMRDWEGWWRPVVAAILPTVLLPAALTLMLNAFGMPTPLYRAEDLRLYVVVSENDLCRNLAVAEFVYHKLESTTLSLVAAYATATTVLTIVDGVLSVVTGGVWLALKYASSALRLVGLQNWVNALTQPILAVLYVYMSFTIIWHIVVFMAKVALWAPLLLSVGVPLVAFSRTKNIGGVAVALAAVAVAVSHFAYLSAWDVYGMAEWGKTFAENLKNATGGLQLNSTAMGAPQLVVFDKGVYYVVYNNTYYASSLQKAYEKSPFLTTLAEEYVKNNPQLKQIAEERRRELLAVLKKWANHTSLYAKNVTNAVMAAAGPAVGAAEWGEKQVNASVWYAWLDMNVTVGVVKCDSLIPPEVEPLFKKGRELASNVTEVVEHAANETCKWLREVNLSDTLVFSHVGRYRTVYANYLYNLTAKWGNSTALVEKSTASGVVGLWHYVNGPDGEECRVGGNSTSCEAADVTAKPGLLVYEASENKATWARPSTRVLEVNFTAKLDLSPGVPYSTRKIPLNRMTEVCVWCARWQCDINGNCWCVDERTSYRDWWEEYTAVKILTPALYPLPRPFAEKPWRFLHAGVHGVLNVTYIHRTWKIDKTWKHGDWNNGKPPCDYCCDIAHYYTPEEAYKYVVLLHVPDPYYRIVYYWAWLSDAEITSRPNKQPALPDVLPESEVPSSAKPGDGKPADYYLEGAEHAVYCDYYKEAVSYGEWKGVLDALRLAYQTGREGLFASLVFKNATASYYQARRIPEGMQWLISQVQGTPAEWAVPALQEGLRYAEGEWHGYLWHPLPEPAPSSYLVHHLYSACAVFEWNPKRLSDAEMVGELKLTPGLEVWAVRAPFAYSNATWRLINWTNAAFRYILTRGFLPPAPREVCITVEGQTVCRTPYLAGVLNNAYWGGGCPYGVNNCGNYTRLDIFPKGPWGAPLVGDFFVRQVYDTFAVALAFGEAWKRLILAGVLVLGVFEAMGMLFGFPTPARLLYAVVSDILSQLGYWMGFRIGLKARLGRRLIQPIRARLARASRLIASKLPRPPRPFGLPSREWLRDPRRWLWERVTRRWEEEKRRQIEERLQKAMSGRREEWEVRMEEKRKWREEAREALKRIYHAAQAHDVLEFLRRISPRIDAYISRIEERLAERHPLLYKWYVLTYHGQYGYLYQLAEPIIRRWEAEGKITKAEAEQLRRLRAALWAAASEAKARAVQPEKGVDEKHVRHLFEYRERRVKEALDQLKLMPYAKSKEELAKRLEYAAAYLQHIDPRGTSRLWDALGIAAEGRPAEFKTTREVVDFLWERRERLDIIVQRARELVAGHYAHASFSIKDIAKEEVARQVAEVKPLLEAAAKARRYAATGEGAEEAVKALKSKEVEKAAKAAETSIKPLQRAAERAYKLEAERAQVLEELEEARRRLSTLGEIQRVVEAQSREEAQKLAEAARALGLEKAAKYLEELARTPSAREEVVAELRQFAEREALRVKELERRLAQVEERLAEARHKLAVAARETLERAARSYRGVLEDKKFEVDPVFTELRRALLEGRLEEAYRQLRERYEREGRDVRRVDELYGQLKEHEEKLQKAREDLRTAVRHLGDVVRAEAVKYAEAVTYLESLFKALPTAAEEDVRRGVEMARRAGLEKTARFLEEYLKSEPARTKYAAAVASASEALEKLAKAEELVAKEHKAAEEKLKRIAKAEDALRRVGQGLEFEQAARQAKEAGLPKTAQFLEKWSSLLREAEERGGLEVVNRLGRALAADRLAEEAAALAAEGKAPGGWYGRVLELKPLYQEAVKEAAQAKAEAEAKVKTLAGLKAAVEKAKAETPADLIAGLSKLGVAELQKAAEAAKSLGLEAAAKYFEELAKFASAAEEKARAMAEYAKVEKRLKKLEAEARVEIYKAEKAAKGLSALLEGREYEGLAYVRVAVKELERAGLSELEAALRKVFEMKPEELQKMAERAREAGLEQVAKAFESAAVAKKAWQEAGEELSQLGKALREPSLLGVEELRRSAEYARAAGFEKAAKAFEEAARAVSEVEAAYKTLEEKKAALASAVEKLGEARREVELLRHRYAYELGAPVWRELRQRGIDTMLLRAPLPAYVTATLDASLLREAAEVFRPEFKKYEREVATTVAYLPVSEGQKLGPVVSVGKALKGEFRPYIEEIAEVKAPTLKQAVKEYYSGVGRHFKQLAYLEARATEAVLDVKAAKKFLEQYAKEGRQEDLALAVASAYRAAKAYQRYQHQSLGELAEVVAEIRRALGLYGRDVVEEALAKAVEQLGGEKALKEALRPKNVQEAVKWLKEAWKAADYRVLESKLGLTRTYAIPDAEKALEYTAKALTPSRLVALGVEEGFSVMRAYSLLREFERFMKERPRESLAKPSVSVVRALERPLPLLQTSAVDKIAREAAAKLVKEAEELAQKHGLRHVETRAVLEQLKELVKISPEAFGELRHAASTAKGPFKEWARQLVAEVMQSWDVYREGWEAPVVQRLEALKKVPVASEAASPVPRELVAVALWAELNPRVKELKNIVREVSPAAVEEASLIAEAIRALKRDLEKLRTVDVEKPIYVAFETLEKKTGRGVEKLDEAAELSKASRYLQHPDPRVREEAELLLKFARGEITRSQLKEELAKRGGPLTEEGREAVNVGQRLREVHAELVSRLVNKIAILKDVEELRREALGAAYWTAVRAGLGDEQAWRELKAAAAVGPAEKAVKYAESLKLLKTLTEGLDKVIYEPELAKRYPELRDVLLERDRALKKAEELEKNRDVEKAVVAGMLREFAEGRITRTQLLKAAEEKGVDLSEFSREKIRELRGDVMHGVRKMAAELAEFRGAPRSLKEVLEAKLPTDLYAELAGELKVRLEEAAAKAGVPAEYAKYGVVQGAAKYVERLTKLAAQLPVDVQAAYAALGAVRHELLAVDELKLLAELANQNYSTVERIKKRIEEAEAEVAKAVYKTIRELGVRRVPYELLEIAAKVEFTPEELRMLLTELEAAKAAERDKAFAWPEFAEYVPLVFATTDEKAARAWRRGGGLVVEATVFVGDKPQRVYILAPRNAPLEQIREALYAVRGLEVLGQPKWMTWDAAEALGLAVEYTPKGVSLKPRVEAFIDLDKPLPYRREVWEALKLTRPDLLREAVGVGWSLLSPEDGLAAVNAYLYVKRLERWSSFEPPDVERAFDEYRKRFTPAFERYLKIVSVERLGFDVVDFLKGAYAVTKRLRGDVAVYKPQDAEAYARLLWWAKKVGRGTSLYELAEPDFRQTVTLKALNIAVKNGYITYDEALELFNSWRRNNDVVKWDEEALRIALRGNLRMKETEEAMKRFVESLKTSKQLEAEEAARERLRLMEEQRRREEEMKKIRGVKERRPAEEARPKAEEAKTKPVEEVKPVEEAKASQPRAEEERQVKEAQKEAAERPAAEKPVEAKRPERPEEAPEEAKKPAEERRPVDEEVTYVKLGYVYVKSTHVENAVVRAFAAEPPENWHLKLTPEAYLELRAGLAPFELEKLEAARERAAGRRRALQLLGERYGWVAVPNEVRRRAEKKAYDEFVSQLSTLAARHDPEAVEAVVNRLKALVAQWVEMDAVPNAYHDIRLAMWTYEGLGATRRLEEEWGYWLFREDFRIVKELAERYGINEFALWNAYRSVVDKYLRVVTSYGDVVNKAVAPIDAALRITLTAAGGAALAAVLHDVVRPELVYAATAAASLALSGRYREAVQRVKTAVGNVRVAVEKLAEGAKVAVERLYEAVVEAAARIVQWFREHWRAVALITAAAAAGLIGWIAAQQLTHMLFIDHSAWLALNGFFGLAWRAEKPERFKVVDLLQGKTPPKPANEAEAFKIMFDASRPEAERRDAAAVFAKSVASRLAYSALVRARVQWLQSEAVEMVAEALAEKLAEGELKPSATEAERKKKVEQWRARLAKAEKALRQLAEYIRQEEEMALNNLKALAEAYDKLKAAEVTAVEFTEGRRGEEEVVVKLTAEGREIAELHITKKTVRLVGEWGSLKAEIKSGGGATEFEAVSLEVSAGESGKKGAEHLRKALEALYKALPQEVRDWLKSDSARAYAVMYELADVGRQMGGLKTVELGSLLVYALVKYAENPDSITRFNIKAIGISRTEARPTYYLFVKDVYTKSSKAALFEAIAALGRDKLEELRGVNPRYVLERGGVALLKKVLGDIYDTVAEVAQRHGEDVAQLLEDLYVVVNAAKTQEGLLGLIMGDGAPKMGSLEIAVGEKWKDGMKTLLELQGIKAREKEKKRNTLLLEKPKSTAKYLVAASAIIKPVFDALSAALYGHEPVLWKWTRLKALAGDEEARALYGMWGLSRRRLWPPPEQIQKGEAVKYVKNGVELWIYKWDHKRIETLVVDGDKSFVLAYYWGWVWVKGGSVADFADAFKKLGVSTRRGEFSEGVGELLREAASRGEAAPRAEYKRRLKELASALQAPRGAIKEPGAAESRQTAATRAAGEVEPEGRILLFRGERTEVRLAEVRADGAVFLVKHAAWERPAVLEVKRRKSGRGEQLRGELRASKERPLGTLIDIAQELSAAGVPAVNMLGDRILLGSSSVDYLMLRDKRAAELWFGEVLYWDDEVRIFLHVVDESHEYYTIAVNDAGWHIYTLAFTLRKGWEGVVYTSDTEAPRRLKKALEKTAPSGAKIAELALRPAQRTYRIRLGGWAREILRHKSQ